MNGITIFPVILLMLKNCFITQEWKWTVKTIRWLLDVHFKEDWCRVENKGMQQSLHIFIKTAINPVKQLKFRTSSKKAISHIMFQYLLDFNMILGLIYEN